MLLPSLILNRYLRLLIVFSIFLFSDCRQDSSRDSEEEIAYLADYEAPSDLWGFIDMEGNLVIEAKYDDVGPFSEQLAAVNKAGKWGYINREGSIVIEPIYKSAWAFHEGFARVLPFDGEDQFIDHKGIPLSAPNWAAADDFSNGRARVKIGNSYGYIDTSGHLVIQPIFERGWNFENSLCVVEYQEKLGVIDLGGNYILEPGFDHIKKTAEGNIILCTKNNRAIAYDGKGNELLNIPTGKMMESNGVLISVRENDKMYLIKISDSSKKSKGYANIIYLEQDLWAGKTDSGYIFLNKEGTPASNNYYTQINKFSNGFAAYSKKDYWGFLDINGTELTGAVFGLAWDYRENFARAAFKEGIAFIDRNQQLAFYPPRGTLDMRDFSEGLAAVQLD